MGYLVHRHDELCIGECRYICTLIHNRPVLSDADVVLLGFHVIVKKKGIKKTGHNERLCKSMAFL